MEREKKVVMMLHIRQNNKMNPCVSSPTQNAAPLAFRPNELNAVIRAAFREGCVWRGERKS